MANNPSLSQYWNALCSYVASLCEYDHPFSPFGAGFNFNELSSIGLEKSLTSKKEIWVTPQSNPSSSPAIPIVRRCVSPTG